MTSNRISAVVRSRKAGGMITYTIEELRSLLERWMDYVEDNGGASYGYLDHMYIADDFLGWVQRLPYPTAEEKARVLRRTEEKT